MSQPHGLVLRVQVGGHLSVSTRPVGVVMMPLGSRGGWRRGLAESPRLVETSAGDFSKVYL